MGSMVSEASVRREHSREEAGADSVLMAVDTPRKPLQAEDISGVDIRTEAGIPAVAGIPMEAAMVDIGGSRIIFVWLSRASLFSTLFLDFDESGIVGSANDPRVELN